MNKKSILTIVCGVLALPALAQMDNVVEVENTYTPVVKDANKINVLPEVETTDVPHYPVKYTDQAQPASRYVFQPTKAAQSEVADAGAPRGFATIGAGVRGMLNLRGAYGLKLSDSDLLDFDLSLRGHKGRVDHQFFDNLDWSSRFYTTRGAVGYTHRFDKGFALEVKSNVESQVFNYMPELVMPSADVLTIPLTTDKQHNLLTELDARITPVTFGDFSVTGNIGYNSFWQKHIHFLPTTGERNREVQIWMNAGIRYQLEKNAQGRHLLGLDIRSNFTSYNFENFDNNNSFTLVPHYAWSADQLSLYAGLQIHFNSGFQSHVRLAPEVRLRFHVSEQMDLFAKAEGGEVRNEYRLFSQITPYWANCCDHQLAHQFDRLRSSVGIDWQLGEGFFTRLYAGYDRSKNRAELYGPATILTADGSLVHLNADFSYQYKDDFNAKLQCQFNGWETEADKAVADDVTAWLPILDFHASTDFRIWQGLRCGVDYVLQTFGSDGVKVYKRPTTNNLGATVSYTMPVPELSAGSNLSVYVKGSNLLNRNYDAYMGYRAQRISFLAGVALTF